jgi:hypothetical protein
MPHKSQTPFPSHALACYRLIDSRVVVGLVRNWLMGVKNGGMWALTATSRAPLALAAANWAMWGASGRLERGIGPVLPHPIRPIVAF